MDSTVNPPPRPQHELAATARQVKAIKRRLLDRMADADRSHLTIAADEGAWQAFIPGVHLKVLHEQGAVLSYLLRLEPGASLPAHRHPLDEECIVLQGSITLGAGTEIEAGAYHLASRGALHARISTRDGATIFLRGAVPAADHVLG